MSGKLLGPCNSGTESTLSGPRPEPIVLKVQFNLSGFGSTILVYNEDKSILLQGPPGEEICRALAGRAIAFFEAFVYENDIEIGNEVGDPGW